MFHKAAVPALRVIDNCKNGRHHDSALLSPPCKTCQNLLFARQPKEGFNEAEPSLKPQFVWSKLYYWLREWLGEGFALSENLS
jgi:hypothetical protein